MDGRQLLGIHWQTKATDMLPLPTRLAASGQRDENLCRISAALTIESSAARHHRRHDRGIVHYRYRWCCDCSQVSQGQDL